MKKYEEEFNEIVTLDRQIEGCDKDNFLLDLEFMNINFDSSCSGGSAIERKLSEMTGDFNY